MSREKLIASTPISRAIISLESSLKETQEGMARRIGCTLGAYVKWRRGERRPRGVWLARIMQLCSPDQANALTKAFIETDDRTEGRKKVNREDDLDTLYKNAEVAVRGLGALKAQGNKAAAEALRSLADQIIRSAGIASDPGALKGRKKDMLLGLLQEISRVDSS